MDWERLKEEIKPMQAQLGREQIAFYSQYDPDSDQYTYSPHGLIFSDEAVAQADGKSYLILFEVKNPESNQLNKVILINAPVSEIGHEELRIWAHGNTNSLGQQNTRTTFMSNSGDGGSGFGCTEDQTWDDEIRNCVFNEVIVEAEPIKEIEYEWDDIWDDDDGGGYPSQPGTDECEVAYDCSTGGGVGSDPLPESCPAGQVEVANGNCIEGEVPCVGNPIKNPRLAAQKKNSGIEGGRFRIGADAVRDGGNRDHFGLDLLVGYGDPLFAMKEGNVKAIGYSLDLGKYVIVSYDNNGEDVWMLYGHLNTVEIDYGNISHGAVIGTAGISGNLEGAIKDGFAVQHVHIETRIGSWSGVPKNPEDYLTTQFDSNGNPISETDC